jgi:membrane associated rhomboid family serine protease
MATDCFFSHSSRTIGASGAIFGVMLACMTFRTARSVLAHLPEAKLRL